MNTNSATGIKWDLSDLYAAHDDPNIEATLKDCRARAEKFAEQFRPLLQDPKTLTPATVLQALKELEIIYEALGRVGSYAGLVYAADTAKPEYQDLEQRVEQRSTEIRNLLLFFELEWLKFDDKVANRIMADPVLAPYNHYLASLRRYRPHTLTEPEEKILNERDNTGRNAFGRLFSEVTSSLAFTLERNGKKEELNLSQILSLLHDPDRALRQRAMETLYEELSQHGQVLTFVYDTLIQDNLTMDRLRRYPNPLAQRHLSNEIDGKAVQTMMAVTEENYGLAQTTSASKRNYSSCPGSHFTISTRPSAKKPRLSRTVKRSRSFSKRLKLSIPGFVKLPPNFSPRIGSTRRFAKANAAAPSAPRLPRNCIRTFSATTTTTCATS